MIRFEVFCAIDDPQILTAPAFDSRLQKRAVFPGNEGLRFYHHAFPGNRQYQVSCLLICSASFPAGTRRCCCFLPAAFNRQNRVHRNRKDDRQRDQIDHAGQTDAVLPLVNRLRRRKAEQELKILYGKSLLFPENTDVLSGSLHIHNRDAHGNTAFQHNKNPPVQLRTSGCIHLYRGILI